MVEPVVDGGKATEDLGMGEPPVESWETNLEVNLAQLKLDKPEQQQESKQNETTPLETEETPSAADAPADCNAPAGASNHAQQAPVNGAGLSTSFPDPALLSALLDQNKERALVIHMEEDVLNFIADASRDILEFPVEYSNYQRMLAHKVAQYHSLQTTTADYEGNQCRVVAHRTGIHDKNKPLLSSLDVTQGSPLALAAKSSGPWQDTPKLLRRQPNRHDRGVYDPNNPTGAPRTTTPKDREEAYDRARARIFTDSESSFAAAGVMGGRGTLGRGAPFPGRGRRGGGRDRGSELHDPDYTRGMNRFGGMGMYDGVMHGMGPTMMMMPQGSQAMYSMQPQQPEMAWGGGMGMYVTGRQPPPPPPGSSSTTSYTSKAGGGAGTPGGIQQGLWTGSHNGNGSAPGLTGTVSTVAQLQPGGGVGTAITAVPPPPPPPPPHGGARPYNVPGSVMTTAPFQAGPGGQPMAIYPGGTMQPMHSMGNMYAYPMPSGGYGYAMVTPEAAMAMAHGPGTHVGGYPSGAYPGSMQAMNAQGYGTAMYASPRAHGPGMAGGMAGAMGGGMVPHSPNSPGMAMAYAPMAMHGYPMQYPMQGHQGGMGTLVSAGSGGLYGGHSPQGTAGHMGNMGYSMAAPNGMGGGGRGGRGGGYKHQGVQSIQPQSMHQSAAQSGPSSTTSLGTKQHEG